MIPDFSPVMPEFFVAIGAMALLLLGVFRGDKGFGLVNGLAVVLLLGVGAFLGAGEELGLFNTERQTTFGDMFVSDSFAILSKILILIGSAVVLMISTSFLKQEKLARFEYPVLVVLSTLGMMIMVSANDLIALYVGLELQSLALYVLAAFNRDRLRSTEAGLKYFVLGALSSGMLLYGISLIYGFTGTTGLDVFASTLQNVGNDNLGLTVGLVFLLAGLSFKIAAVPFHMWSPDVYEGSPTPVTAFFAAAPKIAALMLMVRVLVTGFADMSQAWLQIVIFISVASMLVGAFVALVQTNIKRLLAYSSIGHIGYALVGLAAAGQQASLDKTAAIATGVESVVLYMVIYMTMTLGTFAVVLTMRRGSNLTEKIDDLAGLSKTNLPLAVALATLMFSLAGIPLLAGFFGKWYVFLAAVDAGLWPLALIGLVTSVVSAYYYLRIVKVMFFDEGDKAFDQVEVGAVGWTIGLAAVINSPVSYVFLIKPLTIVVPWAVSGLIF